MCRRSERMMRLIYAILASVLYDIRPAAAMLAGPQVAAVEYCFGRRLYHAVCSSAALLDGYSHTFSLGATSQETFYILRIQPGRRLGAIACKDAKGLWGVTPDCEVVAVKEAGPGGWIYEIAAVKSVPTGIVLSPSSDTVSAAAAVCCSILWSSTGMAGFPKKAWKNDEAEVTMLCGPGKDTSILIPMLPGLTCADFFPRDVESKDCEIVGGPIRPTWEVKRHDNTCDWSQDDS
ncbi:uncharacterized protein L969DRAFT_347930 [Mixia osmundae IAM 14324]|uniref:uncharacterized protein n=1 Tax=Mixia osmundae (strain CBS 9802 / IAM 14324 / JCM 22182 / KY 12970) TaxID=764103 RepID=UPI0004A55402|nr:uncharacterized protein L969DRAFT_347930 [Mixia osmundae IAM 14324]KEI40663.1 hypothetical protein L969DRAFT_347930 [Mixia osmundae IAM 14324]